MVRIGNSNTARPEVNKITKPKKTKTTPNTTSHFTETFSACNIHDRNDVRIPKPTLTGDWLQECLVPCESLVCLIQSKGAINERKTNKSRGPV